MNLSTTRAIELIAGAAHSDRPIIVGIDGRSGAGKSTFAAGLAAVTEGFLVEGDAFYAGGLSVRNDTAEQRSQVCIDRLKLRELLQDLIAGRDTTFLAFDWDAFDGSLTEVVCKLGSANVVIVEGVYTCHPDFDDVLDVRIMIKAASALRERRLIRREGSIGPWERQWHEAEDWYFAKVVDPNGFDLVIDSSDDPIPTA